MEAIGPGVDPIFQVELIAEGRIAAVVSRVSLERFSPDRLQGRTAEDIRWLGEIAARHNEIIRQAASSSPVLPLRLGTVFRSRDSLKAMLVRCEPMVSEFLEELGDRQEWGVKLYWEKHRPEPTSGPTGPSSPHHLRPQQTGASYLAQRRIQLNRRREQRTGVYQLIQTVKQCLTERSESCRLIRNLPSDLTGHAEEMVFNAAFLLPPSQETSWLQTVHDISQNVRDEGLLVEVSGPWPPYHFCPNLES